MGVGGGAWWWLGGGWVGGRVVVVVVVGVVAVVIRDLGSCGCAGGYGDRDFGCGFGCRCGFGRW